VVVVLWGVRLDGCGALLGVLFCGAAFAAEDHLVGGSSAAAAPGKVHVSSSQSAHSLQAHTTSTV
jgi:hypothetical protein